MYIYNKIIPFIKGLLKAYNRKTDYTKQLREIDKRNHYRFNKTLSTYSFTVDLSQVDQKSQLLNLSKLNMNELSSIQICIQFHDMTIMPKD